MTDSPIIDIDRFVAAIMHGDDEHRAWLLAAAKQFTECGTAPPVAGKGRRDAEIATLTAENERLKEKLDYALMTVDREKAICNEAEAMLAVKPSAMEYADQTLRITELEAEQIFTVQSYEEALSQHQWHRVEDELPTERAPDGTLNVIAYGRYPKSRFIYLETLPFDGEFPHGVTHWMPLPEPPTEDK